MTEVAAKTEEVSVATAARMMRCSSNTVYRLIEAGCIDAWRLTPASPWRVDKASVLRYLDRARRNDH